MVDARRGSILLLVLLLGSLVAPPVLASGEPVTLRVEEVLEHPPTKTDSGPVRVRLEILDGDRAGTSFTYEQHLWGNPHYDPDFSPGAVFVGSVSLTNGTVERLELGQSRKHGTLLLLFLVLTVFLVLLAGWEGFVGLLCSLLTLGLLLYGFFPVALGGATVLAAGVGLCVLTILFTVPLVLRGSSPTVPALGSLLLVTALMFVLSRWGMDYLALNPAGARHSRLILTHLNRLPVDPATALNGILVTGIVLGTLGAMMDVAVVISSTVHEITRDAPSIDLASAFASGMTVGREILSTMVNTLIFAYVGILLPFLLAFHAFELSYVRFVNYSFVGVEVLRIGVGLTGLALIIPATALLSAWWSR